ncbi:MAG TPA: FAD-dependent oxidoreductase [Solirubrobacter sp.]|nr:FAD-dependent oxidoreductase [Solirubrobacter sp.]
MTRQPPHIVIAGGGVAAVEAVAALRALAGSRPRITLLAPQRELHRRAASVAAPFGFGAPAPLPFDAIRRHARFALHRGTLARVHAEAHVAIDESGEAIAYDKLLVAIGARPEPVIPGAICFSGPAQADEVARALEQTPSLAFVVPTASGWSLPAYELAIMAAVELRGRGVDPQITVVTPEPAPLWVFGPEAGEAVAALLAERGIALRTGARAIAARDGRVELAGGDHVIAERAIALPRLAGPAVPGIPHDAQGFIAVDAHGRVAGTPDVFAAGDATTFPLKQGGLATQQADAAAEAIAAELGAAVEPAPFRPVLRGLLVTGGAPLYLRAALSTSGAPETSRRFARTTVSQRALWSPPTKVAGRYLAPLLATARPPLAGAQLQDYVGGPAADDRDDARELALLLAAEEAAIGDYAQALRALDAAAAMTGGVLPAEWARRRAGWEAARAEAVRA